MDAVELSPSHPESSRVRSLRSFIPYFLILLFALVLRLPHFTPLALIGSDGSEYVYCVQKGMFPHSPYVLHMWAGYLLDPLAPLDWGYAILSLVSSLVSIPLFGWTIACLSGDRGAGWVAAGVLAITPVCIRYAGIQEVYAFQFLFLSLSWWLMACRRSTLSSGLAFGAAFATHSGTVFAIPHMLLLMQQVFRPDPPPGRKQWLRFGCGFLLALALAVGWLTAVWTIHHGISNPGLFLRFLRGAAPTPDYAKMAADGLTVYVAEQLQRTWADLSDFEVFGYALLLGGTGALCLSPALKSAAWWSLSIPYLLYEIGMGYSLDEGIFLIFVSPSLAAGIGLCFGSFCRNPRSPMGLGRLAVVFATLVGGLIALPRYQETAEKRSVLPWIQPTSSTMALCEFVREETPADTLVIQPVDWDPTGLASALYSDRIPLFNDGEILLPAPWKPLFTHPDFNHVRSITTEDFDRWIDEERPLVSFDSNPFTSWGCYWPFVDIERFETRPILWIDQNQSGTSRLKADSVRMATIDIGNPTDEAFFQLKYPETHQPRSDTLPLYRPTLFHIARRSDPPEPPDWVRTLQEKVPSSQRGNIPEFTEEGIFVSESDQPVVFKTPAVSETPHLICALINSGYADYILEAQVKQNGRWRNVGRDMEKIVVAPFERFTELCFYVPGRLVEENMLEARLQPVLGTSAINVYRIEVYALRPG